MHLLFDEQLSEALSFLLRDVFPDSLHVRQIGAGGSPDSTVWALAKNRGCLLVTKDEDFHRLSILRGAPPKVVWLRLGNCTTEDVARFCEGTLPIYRSSRNRRKPLFSNLVEAGTRFKREVQH